MIVIINGNSWKRGNNCVIKKIFVVIIVVVCIKVEIGVGFFIVFGNYICNGNCVDFVIGFKNKRRV